MRGLFTLSGLIVALAAVVGFGTAADDKTYDLRGPAPTKGQVFVSKSTLNIKEADTTMTVLGQKLEGKMTMVMTDEEEAKVLAVDGRNVTKCQTKIIKERADVTLDLAGMKIPPVTEPTKLEGEIIISERVGENKWKHSLVDTQASAKQKKELDARNGIENEDDLYPADKVKVGHEWKVDAKALTKLFGNSFTDIKGSLKQKFVKVEELNDEECAVVESNGTVKGKMKDEDGQPTTDVEMELKLTTWRSVKTGVALKEKFDGKIKLTGTVKMNDIAVDITMSGPLTGEGTTKLKE